MYEPADGWSAANLLADHGAAALSGWRAAYPMLDSVSYPPGGPDLDAALDGADLVLVHEWNDPALVARIGAHRRCGGRYLLLFHDTHHRVVSDPAAIRAFDLESYDGVLAFGEVLRDAYLRQGWARRAFTWHEAADIALFRPPETRSPERDLVWVGNWGDGERTAELDEFLIGPIRDLGLSALIHGVRYPDEALAALSAAGIAFSGYLPNVRVPAAFAAARLTVHVPRRPYVRMLPGIPTIRVFEALACGIPLVSAPWIDAEGLFSPGLDYLVAEDGAAMRRHMRLILNEPEIGRALAEHGLRTVQARHSCAHRVDELLSICRQLGRELALPQLTEV
jgi:spore maturation protein CgeB